VRDFVYEPFPNTSKAPEFFDPLSALIAADWQMRNMAKNSGMLPPKSIWRLVKIGWLTVEEVKVRFHVRDYLGVVRYNALLPEERYPFVLPRNVRMPTPAMRVRMRRMSGLPTHENDLPDSVFFGCEHHDNEYGRNGDDRRDLDDDDRGRPPTPRDPVVAALEEAEASGSGPGSVSAPAPGSRSPRSGTAATGETGARRKKGTGKGTAKSSRGRAKKPLRREYSRPEV